MSLPSYEQMRGNYPNLPADQVYKLIGGMVYELYINNPKDYANACALRMSRAFNYAGHPIMKSSKYYMEPGDDKKYYIFRKSNMIEYIKDRYSLPDYTISKEANSNKVYRKKKGDTKKEEFENFDSAIKAMKGIIVFDVHGWSNATGHVTLFSYSKSNDLAKKCEDNNCYFEHHQPNVFTSKIQIWNLT